MRDRTPAALAESCPEYAEILERARRGPQNDEMTYRARKHEWEAVSDHNGFDALTFEVGVVGLAEAMGM